MRYLVHVPADLLMEVEAESEERVVVAVSTAMSGPDLHSALLEHHVCF